MSHPRPLFHTALTLAGHGIRRLPVILAAMLPAAVHTTVLAAEPLPSKATEPIAAAPVFERDIRPILKAHCFDCHGEGDTLRGGLDLRLARLMRRGGDSGPALSPGHPDASPVFTLVHSGEMPKRDRKPTAAEVELIRRWILAGAPTLRPEPEHLDRGMQITPEERAHWSFQPLRKPPIPTPTPDSRVRNPVDAFIAQRLHAAHLDFSPDAPPATLARRAYLGLLGIPPSPEELDAFLADPRPDAYERLVDRLLASPRYGERWARHWLDVAGYADSDGYTNDDNPRPYAYKYRDYVIRAFNADKPFRQFILEQLAGDELALARHPSLAAAAQDPETRDWLAATGFLRMAADGTASSGIDQDTARNQVVADTLKIVSTSLLGLSVGCAQCHDHRYDPIPQSDYYRLRAIFEPAYDWKNWRTPAQRLVSLYTNADRQKAADIEKQAQTLVSERESKQAQYLDQALRTHLEKFDPTLRDALWSAFKTPANERSPDQQRLLKEHPSANIHPGVLYQYLPKAAEDLKAMDARIAEIRAARPPEDFIATLWEPADQPAPVTHLFHRGDPRQPKDPVPPGTLTVLQPDGCEPSLPPPPDGLQPASSSGRRLAFAHWVTSPRNPLLPRLIVNRVWMHHFGRGLVGTPADFGLQGETPSHPELLDWLASCFLAEEPDPAFPAVHGSLKELHRLILTSTTFRQSSQRRPDAEAADPENRLYGRKPIQRLDAETLRDCFLAVSGSLSSRMFGTPVPVREDVVGQIVVGIDRKQGDNKMPVEVPMGEDEFRRGIYIEVRRSKPLAFLNAFDAPVMEVNCERRPSSTVAPQALMLMNSDFALQQARHFADRVRREAGECQDLRLERAWQLAYGRHPSSRERELAHRFLEQHRSAVPSPTPASAAATPTAERPGSPDRAAKTNAPDISPDDRAWRSLCQTLLGSNEFLYLD